MIELPDGWALPTLDEVADVRLGRQRSPKNHTGDRMRPYLRAANVTWRGIELNDVKEMNFTDTESATYELRRGDLLVTEASGSAAEVGKPAIWAGEIDGCCFQNTLIRVRMRHGVPEFVRYFLLMEARSGRIGRASPGVGIHHIGASRLAAWRIPFPPVGEQRRVVAAIDLEFSRLDAAAAALANAETKLAQLKEIADSLLVADWPRKRLCEICPIFVDCPHRTPKYQADGLPAIRPRDVVNGKLRLDTAARVGPVEYELQTKRRVPIEGDVIYSRELSYGWAAVVPANSRICLSQGMVLFRPNATVLPEFLALVLNGSLGRKQARSAATGSAHPHINLRDIREYEVPVPPIEAQRQIVARACRQYSAIDALDTAIGRARRRSTMLRNALLELAFNGKLVAHDPTDDSAQAMPSAPSHGEVSG